MLPSADAQPRSTTTRCGVRSVLMLLDCLLCPLVGLEASGMRALISSRAEEIIPPLTLSGGKPTCQHKQV